jgi:hypothetical protein
MSLWSRLEALEAAQPGTRGIDLSPAGQAAALERIRQRIEAWSLAHVATQAMTAEERAARDAAEEAAFLKDRAANPIAFDVGCRFTMKAALQSALQRRSGLNDVAIADHGAPLVGTLVPSLCGPQADPQERTAAPVRYGRRAGVPIMDSLPESVAWGRET